MCPAAVGRPAKRLRAAQDYRPGSVMKVEVRNFMTYAQAVIEPGPRLNLVLGPNGTGKSSFVCALCVGLAGSTKLLGRAEEVSQFVRRGCNNGDVTITLAGTNPARPHVVRRRIHAADNRSEWWLNGHESAMNEVVKLVKGLNIQLDNLCQFLPQDKVVEFARMKPVQLLQATEEAVGDSSLKEMHELLVARRKDFEQHTAAEKDITADLEELKADNARAERTVQQIRDQERLKEEAEVLRQKVPWAEYAQAKRDFQTEKDKLKETEAQLARMKARQADEDRPLREKLTAAQRAADAEQRAKEAAARANPLQDQGGGWKDLQQTADDLSEKISAKMEELEGLEGASESRLRKIEALKGKVETCEEDIARLQAAVQQGDPAAERRRKELELQMRDLNNQEVALQSRKEAHSSELDEANRQINWTQQHLSRLDDGRQIRLRALEPRNHGITRAADWVRQHRNDGTFRGVVLGPIAAEVDCPDPTHAAMLEAQVSATWWAHFVVEHRDDMDLLKSRLKSEHNFDARVSFYSGNSTAALHHPLGRGSDYGRFGVTTTLDEVFKAPLLVKHALDDNFYLSRTFVAKADADWQGFLDANNQVQNVYTPSNKMVRKTSQYNAQAMSTMITALRPAQVFVGGDAGGSPEERAQLQTQLNAQRAAAHEAHSKAAELDPDLKTVKERKAKVQRDMAAIKKTADDIFVKLRQAKTKKCARVGELERLESTPDPIIKKPALEKEKKALAAKAQKAVLDLTAAMDTWIGLLQTQHVAELAARELHDQAEKMRGAAEADRARLRDSEAAVDRFKMLVREKKEQSDRKHAAAKEKTGFPIPANLAAKFATLSNDPVELRSEAEAKQDEADGLNISDPSALEMYRARCDSIARNEQDLAAVTEKRELAEAEIAEVNGRWLGELRRITETVNSVFSAAFPSVGCAGEVVLKEAENNDFANYAIEIRVKFRESEMLSTLDANRQSGGERSVSTILFLVALQGVAAAPFRVVDEINQGMDAVNERKVFRLLVDAATAPDTPQCFLLTPKLLPELPFSAEVTVLQIFNGTRIADVAQGFRQERLTAGRGGHNPLLAAA